VHPRRDATGSPGQEPGFHRVAQGFGHHHRVEGPVDRRGASTPSQPSSMASAASEAVPTPASSKTGTLTRSQIIAMAWGFAIRVRTDRRAERHHRDAANLL